MDKEKKQMIKDLKKARNFVVVYEVDSNGCKVNINAPGISLAQMFVMLVNYMQDLDIPKEAIKEMTRVGLMTEEEAMKDIEKALKKEK